MLTTDVTPHLDRDIEFCSRVAQVSEVSSNPMQENFSAGMKDEEERRLQLPLLRDDLPAENVKYDKDFQTSELMVLFPLHYLSYIVSYIIALSFRSNDTASKFVQAFPIFFYVFWWVIILARASCYRQATESSLKCVYIPVQEVLSTAWYRENHSKEEGYMETYPRFWFGDAIQWYTWYLTPVLVSSTIECANVLPILNPLALASVWFASLTALNFGLCCGWTPNETAIKYFMRSIKCLGEREENIRANIHKKVRESAFKWHNKFSLPWGMVVSISYAILAGIGVSVMWILIEVGDGSNLIQSGKNNESILIVGAVCGVAAVIISVLSFSGVFFTDLTTSLQTILMRLDYLTDILAVENVEKITQLGNNKIIAGFEKWLELRAFMERHDCNYPFTAMSSYFGLQLILAMVGMLGILVIQISSQTPFMAPLYWLFIYTTVACTIFALYTGNQIAGINNNVDTQINRIKDHIRLIDFDLHQDFIYKNMLGEDCDQNKLKDYLNDFILRLRDDHVAPKVLGITISPEVFLGFQGYIAAGVTTIVIQYLSTNV